MRHAEAAPAGGGADHERPLTDAGRAAAAARGPLVRGLAPDVVLCSSAMRTRQTLAALDLSGGTVTISEDLYHGGPGAVVEQIRGVDPDAGTVLVVGHLPTVEVMVRDLLHDDAALGPFRPGSMAVLQVPGPWAELWVGATRLLDFLA